MGLVLGILGVVLGCIIAGCGLWFGLDGVVDMITWQTVTFWALFWAIIGLLVMAPIGIWAIFGLGAIGAVIDE
jgi:hypothetical protein